MSLLGQSLLNIEKLSTTEIESIFDLTRIFKTEFTKKNSLRHLLGGKNLDDKVVTMAFFEPSTRTRMSFQMAAFRLGMRAIALDNLSISSISKGETLMDTVLNLNAMMPDLLVVRYGVNEDLAESLKSSTVPVINAGCGTAEHPTQALLDAYTIFEHRGSIKGAKVLIVGDVLHSRVANSNLQLLTKFGAEVAYCAPEELAPHGEKWKAARKFTDLNEAMAWADVCMCLRVQKERHPQTSVGLISAEYREKYRVGNAQLKVFKSDGILMHPGPVIRGVEISSFAMDDSRSRILEQVKNGVFVRAVLLAKILGIEVRVP